MPVLAFHCLSLWAATFSENYVLFCFNEIIVNSRTGLAKLFSLVTVMAHYCLAMQLSLGTKEIRFGRNTNEIAKFSILDEKTKFTILDEIWMKNGQLIAEPNAVRDRGTSKRSSCAEHTCRWHLPVRCDTGTTMSIKSGACLCGTCNMPVAQYKISADIKSALTFQ